MWFGLFMESLADQIEQKQRADEALARELAKAQSRIQEIMIREGLISERAREGREFQKQMEEIKELGRQKRHEETIKSQRELEEMRQRGASARNRAFIEARKEIAMTAEEGRQKRHEERMKTQREIAEMRTGGSAKNNPEQQAEKNIVESTNKEINRLDRQIDRLSSRPYLSEDDQLELEQAKQTRDYLRQNLGAFQFGTPEQKQRASRSLISYFMEGYQGAPFEDESRKSKLGLLESLFYGMNEFYRNR
ncbi:MAG: hypothetical protein QXW98_05790 [Candidatus Caldarchaeum sp.]